MLPNFKLTANEKITKLLVQKDLQTYHEAIRYVHSLPYGRNSSKENLATVLEESRGTCSSKHALLKLVAEENSIQSVELHMCIYTMNEENTPGVGAILQKYDLLYILEAHVYLCYGSERFDYTFPNTKEKLWEDAIIVETSIDTDDIIDYKNEYHKSFMEDWLQRDKLSYSLEELWSIREECIKNLSQ